VALDNKSYFHITSSTITLSSFRETVTQNLKMSHFFPYLSQFISHGHGSVQRHLRYMETHLCRPHLVPFKAVHLIQVANLRYPLDPMKTGLCTVYSSECRDSCSSSRAAACPSKWIVTCNQFSLENSIFSPILVEKGCRTVRWTAGSSAHVQYGTKTIELHVHQRIGAELVLKA
jgi:hypothetical protein